MANLRAIISVLPVVASRVMRTLIRVAKQWARPGAGPRLVTG
jgi:hypothetical protein